MPNTSPWGNVTAAYLPGGRLLQTMMSGVGGLVGTNNDDNNTDEFPQYRIRPSVQTPRPGGGCLPHHDHPLSFWMGQHALPLEIATELALGFVPSRRRLDYLVEQSRRRHPFDGEDYTARPEAAPDAVLELYDKAVSLISADRGNELGYDGTSTRDRSGVPVVHWVDPWRFCRWAQVPEHEIDSVIAQLLSERREEPERAELLPAHLTPNGQAVVETAIGEGGAEPSSAGEVACRLERWSDLTLRFVDGHTVTATIEGEPGNKGRQGETLTCEALGLSGRNSVPARGWRALELLAEHRGDVPKADATVVTKQAWSDLRRALRQHFSMDESPISFRARLPVGTEGYHAEFNVYPLPLDDRP